MSDEAKVIPLHPGTTETRVQRPEVEDAPVSPVTEDKQTFCLHRSIRITGERRVWCKECDEYVDPIDYLQRLARDWGWVVTQYKDATSKLAAVTVQLANRERDERNARARMKRLKEKGADVLLDVTDRQRVEAFILGGIEAEIAEHGPITAEHAAHAAARVWGHMRRFTLDRA